MIKSECVLEVRYYETDRMGIVHHSNYIRYFECGRHKLLQDIGLPVEEVEARGYQIPVVTAKCTYKVSATMGDILKVVSTVEEKPMAKIKVKAKIINTKDDTLMADGEVVIGLIDGKTKRPVRLPCFMLEVMDKYF